MKPDINTGLTSPLVSVRLYFTSHPFIAKETGYNIVSGQTLLLLFVLKIIFLPQLKLKAYLELFGLYAFLLKSKESLDFISEKNTRLV